VRIGVLGGTFDPVHRGHVALARAARSELGLARVLFLPTARPPHKAGHELAPALARYAMVELALLDEPDLWVSPLELDERRTAYAVDSLDRLRREAPDDDYVLLVGADSLEVFDTWRRWRDLVTGFEIGVLPRAGFERSDVLARMAPELRHAVREARLTWVRRATHPASATEIRRLLRAGEAAPEGWLDERVLSFLAKYRLYR
jgi:nicotinate-nucleotide adenylyltransferase